MDMSGAAVDLQEEFSFYGLKILFTSLRLRIRVVS